MKTLYIHFVVINKYYCDPDPGGGDGFFGENHFLPNLVIKFYKIYIQLWKVGNPQIHHVIAPTTT